MVEYNIIFAGFLPCRIAVVEDSEGKGWIVTMNMDMMLQAVDLPEDLQPLAVRVRDTIYSIVDGRGERRPLILVTTFLGKPALCRLFCCPDY